MGTGALPGVKQLGHEVYHLASSSARVKNECSHNSTPPTCLHSTDKIPFSASNLETASKIHCVPETAFCDKDMGMSGLFDSNAVKLQMKTVCMQVMP